MLDKLVSMVSLRVIVLVLVTALSSGFIYWIKWSFDMSNTVTTQKATIKTLKEDIIALQGEIDDFKVKDEEIDNVFKGIEDDQLDLLCAARYTVQPPAVVKSTPVIVEVVKYRDRVTQCPTTDLTKAEDITSGATMRPVNDEIRLRALNNSWNAYCAATGNKEEVCTPFR